MGFPACFGVACDRAAHLAEGMLGFWLRRVKVCLGVGLVPCVFSADFRRHVGGARRAIAFQVLEVQDPIVRGLGVAGTSQKNA